MQPKTFSFTLNFILIFCQYFLVQVHFSYKERFKKVFQFWDDLVIALKLF